MGAGGGAAAGERERGREHPAAKEAGWALAAALLQVREREGESTRRPRRPGGRWRWRCCR